MMMATWSLISRKKVSLHTATALSQALCLRGKRGRRSLTLPLRSTNRSPARAVLNPRRAPNQKLRTMLRGCRVSAEAMFTHLNWENDCARHSERASASLFKFVGLACSQNPQLSLSIICKLVMDRYKASGRLRLFISLDRDL